MDAYAGGPVGQSFPSTPASQVRTSVFTDYILVVGGGDHRLQFRPPLLSGPHKSLGQVVSVTRKVEDLGGLKFRLLLVDETA